MATSRADIEPDGPAVSPLNSLLPLVFVLSDDVGASRKAFGGVESDLPSTMLETAKQAVPLDFAGIMGFSLSYNGHPLFLKGAAAGNCYKM